MTYGSCKKGKFFWPKKLVKKWFNVKNKAEDFHIDNVANRGCDGDWRNNFSERQQACCSVKKSKIEKSCKRNPDRLRRLRTDLDFSSHGCE